MSRLAYILAHPIAAQRFRRACRAPWPTLEADQ